MRRLKSIARLVVDGGQYGEFPYVGLEHVQSGMAKLDPDAELSLSVGGVPGACFAQPGDVLFGKLRPYLAKTLLVKQPIYASTELMTLRPTHDVDARFFAYLLASRPVVEWAMATADGTKMPRTSWEKLGEYRVFFLPSETAQVVIADFLDLETARIDALIAMKRQLGILMVERLRALVAEKTLDGNADAGQSSAARQLRRLFRVVNGGTPKSDPENWDGEFAWATPSDLAKAHGRDLFSTDRTLTTVGIAEAGPIVPVGSLLVSNRAPIGYVVMTRVPTSFSQGCKGLVPRAGVDARFFLYQLSALEEQLKSLGQGSTFLELSTDAVSRLCVNVPGARRQREVSVLLDKATHLASQAAELIDRQVDLLRERRQALITAAVTGELDIPGAVA